MTQSTKFSILDLVIYTVWTCLKGVTPYNTFKEESSHKNHYDDNYSASITRCTLSFALKNWDLKTFEHFFKNYYLPAASRIWMSLATSLPNVTTWPAYKCTSGIFCFEDCCVLLKGTRCPEIKWGGTKRATRRASLNDSTRGLDVFNCREPGLVLSLLLPSCT